MLTENSFVHEEVLRMEAFKRAKKLADELNLINARLTAHYDWPAGTWAAEQLKRTLAKAGSTDSVLRGHAER